MTQEDSKAVEMMFGKNIVDEVYDKILLKDLGDPLYKAAFIPSKNEIWINSKCQIEPATLVHEVAHYYQKNILKINMNENREVLEKYAMRIMKEYLTLFYK